MTKQIAGLLLAALAAAPGCGDDDPGILYPDDVAPQLSALQRDVITPGCANFRSCHDADAPASRLDLTDGQSWAELVDQPSYFVEEEILVIPGDPENSFLIKKLRGNLEAHEKDPMPLDNDPLPEHIIQAFEQWIRDGALPD